ncbi:MAG TPA: phosphoribosylamine--glycine ligase, partial [Bacteroidales bacterium]|nr:phosphoribosylamine--glycine ligase [Bacteroidales bacterium]
QQNITMVVVGPEAPLVEGIADFIGNDPLTRDVRVIGPAAAGARLEGSKVFAKEFMRRHGIPTAASRMFDREHLEEARHFIQTSRPPYVLKADGLAAGKGVLICQDTGEALRELDAMLIHEKFGDASHRVLIEEFLQGIELSAFVITDGTSYRILPEAKDYKRIGDGDTGPNTGGMGSVSPVPFADDAFKKKLEDRIIRPTIQGLLTENIPYSGFLFFGLIKTNNEPYLIEYNVRMGDPETEAILPRLKTDLLELFEATASGRLAETTVEIDPRVCATVMIASKGYPGPYEKGKPIHHTGDVSGCILFHAGTSPGPDPGEIRTNGGRVLAVSTMGDTLEQALALSYKNARIIAFDGMYFRTDIGNDLLNEVMR